MENLKSFFCVYAVSVGVSMIFLWLISYRKTRELIFWPDNFKKYLINNIYKKLSTNYNFIKNNLEGSVIDEGLLNDLALFSDYDPEEIIKINLGRIIISPILIIPIFIMFIISLLGLLFMINMIFITIIINIIWHVISLKTIIFNKRINFFGNDFCLVNCDILSFSVSIFLIIAEISLILIIL